MKAKGDKAKKGKKEEERGGELTCSGSYEGSRWCSLVAVVPSGAAVDGGERFLPPCFPLFFSLFFLFLLLLFFLPFFLFGFSFSFLPLRVFFFFFLSVFPPSPFFFLIPPVFIGKNRGGTWLGRPLCCHPKNCPRNTSPPSSPTHGKLWASGVDQNFKTRIGPTGRLGTRSTRAWDRFVWRQKPW